jgi:small ligand-binding sensory domain FIST
MTDLRFAAALSTHPETELAASDVCTQLAREIRGKSDLGLVFISHHHGPDFGRVAEIINDQLHIEHLIGCTGEAIVGGRQEIERQPAISLWLARLPSTEIKSMHIEWEETTEGGVFVGWPDDLNKDWPERAVLLTLGDPFSFPADTFLRLINEEHPRVPVIGGMASGARSRGENKLLLGHGEFDSGAVAVYINGPVRVRSVVSQGCRPIGSHFVVTDAEKNVILELGGRPAVEQLKELFQASSPAEQELIQSGLHVGRVINEYQDQFGRGDFLVRNVIGFDQEKGALSLADHFRRGQTAQFHVRDAESADEDLREMLRNVDARDARGALLFTCNGRGTRLFGYPNHDAGLLSEQVEGIPTSGFFAQGELGPIGGTNFIHGYTASIALFEPEGVSE